MSRRLGGEQLDSSEFSAANRRLCNETATHSFTGISICSRMQPPPSTSTQTAAVTSRMSLNSDESHGPHLEELWHQAAPAGNENDRTHSESRLSLHYGENVFLFFLFCHKPHTGFHSTLQGNKKCEDNWTFLVQCGSACLCACVNHGTIWQHSQGTNAGLISEIKRLITETKLERTKFLARETLRNASALVFEFAFIQFLWKDEHKSWPEGKITCNLQQTKKKSATIPC